MVSPHASVTHLNSICLDANCVHKTLCKDCVEIDDTTVQGSMELKSTLG